MTSPAQGEPGNIVNGHIGLADAAINYTAKLYAIEKQAKGKSNEARRQLRQDKSVPILNSLREWLDKTLNSTLRKGPLGNALGYLNKNWEELIRYAEDSDVNIDNNLAENAIRPFAIGRNYPHPIIMQGLFGSL
ncbi:IS66 family transposase, partial [Zhongshania antarctica]|uniref:IS66 family transposase n=1 Tax=Zhongshania antarctica TaxID=641702 RepID=UPI0030B8A361